MHQDRRYTKWLESEHVDFTEYPMFPLEKLDLHQSLQNQARMDAALNPVKVTEYARLLKEGRAEFPPIMVCQPSEWKNGKWLIITGNHRVQGALEAGLQHFDAYHVTGADTDPYVRDLLVRTANIVEGDTLSQSERVSQAVHMIRTYNRSVREVADAFHVHPSTITDRLRSERTKERLASQGFDVTKLSKQLNRGALARLDTLQSDIVLKEAARTIQDGKLSLEATTQLVQSVIHRGSEAQQLAHLHKVRESVDFKASVQETRAGKLRPTGPRWALFAQLRTLNTLIAARDSSLVKLGVTDAATYERFCEHANRLVDALRDLQRQGPPGLPRREQTEVGTPTRPDRVPVG